MITEWKILFQGMFSGLMVPCAFVQAIKGDWLGLGVCSLLMLTAFWSGADNCERLLKKRFDNADQ